MLNDLRVAPKPVAFARMCIGMAALAIALEGHSLLARIRGGKLAVSLFDWWPNVTAVAEMALLAFGILAGVGLTVGCCTRWCAGATGALQLAILLTDQQLYSSHRVLLLLLSSHLVFAQSDAVWSVRSRYRGAQEAVPFWPQLLMMGAVSSLYLFAGISKINSVFLSGDVLQANMVIGLPGWFLRILAFATVATEISLGLGLWFRRTRVAAVVVGVALHGSIVVLLSDQLVLASFALLCVGIYPIILSRPTGSVVIRERSG